MGLPSVAIRKPVLTWVIFAGLMLLGIITVFMLPVELYQGSGKGIISIIIRARGGLAPVDVEKMITRPVEEAVSTTSHLKNMYSNSREAESRVTLEFEAGTDMKFAALEVREKFSRVKGRLPSEIEKPVIANYQDTDAAILIVAVTSETLSPEETRGLVDEELKPRLDRVDGVASVEVYGGRERKILVELDRDKMFAYKVSVERVMDVLGANNVALLAGSVERGAYDFAIRTMGVFKDVDEIGEIGVKATRQGSIIPLKEIATIKDSFLEPEDYSRFNLNQNVSLYVKKSSLANTIKVVDRIQRVLTEFTHEHKSTIKITIVSDKAKLIKRAIGDVRDSLVIGVILVSVIVYFSLGQWALSLIVLTTIPISIITTFFFMGRFGFSLNVMTLSGLALSIGILVDSAVVVVENTVKKKEEGHEHTEAVTLGAEEMWVPLLASLLTNLCVFLPIIMINKEIQLLYQGFVFAVCMALAMGLVVAVMFVPMLLSKIEFTLGGSDSSEKKVQKSIQFLETMRTRYLHWLDLSFKYRHWLLGLIVVLFLVSLAGLVKRDKDSPTQLEENEFSIIVFPLAGAKLDTNDEVAKRLEKLLHDIKDVEMISSTIQKDDLRLFIRLKPRAKRRQSKEVIMDQIRKKGNELVKQIHDEYSLIVDEGAASEESKKLVVHIFGLENDALEKLAHEMAGRLNQVKGLTNLVMTDLRKRPEYSVMADRARAAFYGFTVRDIADSIHAQIRGMRPTKFHELKKGLEIETITRLQAVYRQKIDDLQDVYLISPKTGTQVALKQLAGFYPSKGPQTIDRKDKYRYVFLKGDVHRPLGRVARDAKEAFRGLEMPKDYFWRFGGSYEGLMESMRQMAAGVVVAIFLVYMVLACLYQSYTEPAKIMIAIPLAFIGVYAALFYTHKPLSEQVFIGMIILLGYVVHSSIILIDHTAHLKQTIPDLKKRLAQAAHDRFRPILITSCATVMGFVPMAFSRSESSELWAPLAITMIGGIVSSTVLTLFIIPNLYLYGEDLERLGQWLARRKIGDIIFNFRFLWLPRPSDEKK